MTGSIYIVVMVALERYFNICKPFRFTQQVITFVFSSILKDIYLKSKMFAGEGYILFTIIFSFVYNINKFLEFTTIHQDVHFNETTRSDIFKIF